MRPTPHLLTGRGVVRVKPVSIEMIKVSPPTHQLTLPTEQTTMPLPKLGGCKDWKHIFQGKEQAANTGRGQHFHHSQKGPQTHFQPGSMRGHHLWHTIGSEPSTWPPDTATTLHFGWNRVCSITANTSAWGGQQRSRNCFTLPPPWTLA